MNMGSVFVAAGCALFVRALWKVSADAPFRLMAGVTFLFALSTGIAAVKRDWLLEALMMSFTLVAWKIAYNELKKRETSE